MLTLAAKRAIQGFLAGRAFFLGHVTLAFWVNARMILK
jgi:hypothetical protein